VPQLVQRGLQIVETAALPGSSCEPSGRQFDAASGTPEQRHLQVVLERLDLHADRGRRDVQRVGGFRKLSRVATASKTRKASGNRSNAKRSPAFQRAA
jgi:hypothetical protein